MVQGGCLPTASACQGDGTAYATVLLPVVDRLRELFHIGRVCVVVDRGMISAANRWRPEEPNASKTARHWLLARLVRGP